MSSSVSLASAAASAAFPSTLDHTELVGEMTVLEKMSTQERLKHAKKRRVMQLKEWSCYEKRVEKEHVTVMNQASSTINRPQQYMNGRVGFGHSSSKAIRFDDTVKLLEAAARGAYDEVKDLLDLGVDPNSANQDGLSALHQCCIDQCESIIRLLLEYKADVNCRDAELWTPLHAAATCGHLNLCKILIEHGANLLAVNADGNMPYDVCEDEPTLDYIEGQMATRGITQELIDDMRLEPERRMLRDLQYVISRGGVIPPNATGVPTSDSASILFEADMASSPTSIGPPSCMGADQSTGATLLHIAAANNYVDVMEFLLHHRVNVDPIDCDGWTPLHAAACWGNIDCLEILAYHGADLEAVNRFSETPLDVTDDPDVKNRLIQLKEERRQLAAAQQSSPSHRTSSISRPRGGSFRGRGKQPSFGSTPTSETLQCPPECRHYLSNSQASCGLHSASQQRSVVRRSSMRDKREIKRREAQDEAAHLLGGWNSENGTSGPDASDKDSDYKVNDRGPTMIGATKSRPIPTMPTPNFADISPPVDNSHPGNFSRGSKLPLNDPAVSPQGYLLPEAPMVTSGGPKLYTTNHKTGNSLSTSSSNQDALHLSANPNARTVKSILVNRGAPINIHPSFQGGAGSTSTSSPGPGAKAKRRASAAFNSLFGGSGDKNSASTPSGDSNNNKNSRSASMPHRPEEASQSNRFLGGLFGGGTGGKRKNSACALVQMNEKDNPSDTNGSVSASTTPYADDSASPHNVEVSLLSAERTTASSIQPPPPQQHAPVVQRSGNNTTSNSPTSPSAVTPVRLKSRFGACCVVQ